MDLIKEFEDLKQYLPKCELRAEKVSKNGVDWHLDHSCKVINGVYQALQESKPEQYKPKFSFWRQMVMLTGVIPRGVGKAPKVVRPPEVIVLKDIEKQLALCEVSIRELDNLPENAHFKHPVFGHLNRKQTRKFLAIHTRHHLKIIKDICAN